jgi:hypothetical protein
MRTAAISSVCQRLIDDMLTPPFNISWLQGLAAVGRFAEGVALIDDTIQRVVANGHRCYLPETARERWPACFDATLHW